jgi:hypothetical protein
MDPSARPIDDVFAVDLHTHSRFFHAGSGPTRYDPVGLRVNAAAARVRGVDALAVTNHDYTYTAETGVPTLPGIEVSTTAGHVLVVGPDPPSRTTPEAWTPAETVARAHERDCVAILAHPFRNSTARESDADFDHVARTREYARRRDLPLVGGSDAHYPVEVGRAYTLVDADRDDVQATPGTGTSLAATVVDAIREGRVSPAVELGPLDRLVARGYRRSHGSKGWLDADTELEADADPDPDPDPDPGVGPTDR